MVGWHHRHGRHGFGWTPGVSDGQGGLVCCGPWGLKESDTTERLKVRKKTCEDPGAEYFVYWEDLASLESGEATSYPQGVAPGRRSAEVSVDFIQGESRNQQSSGSAALRAQLTGQALPCTICSFLWHHLFHSFKGPH